jgi:hypothetical protein
MLTNLAMEKAHSFFIQVKEIAKIIPDDDLLFQNIIQFSLHETSQQEEFDCILAAIVHFRPTTVKQFLDSPIGQRTMSPRISNWNRLKPTKQWHNADFKRS